MLEAWIQGIDLASGELMFEWRRSDHIHLWETYRQYSSSDAPFTPVHLNSIDPLADGNLLVSARHTWTVYKIDRRSCEVLWRLGGKQSDFAPGPGVHFAWQHDAQWHRGNDLSMFDNESAPPEAQQSRGLVLHITERKRVAAFVRAYYFPSEALLVGAQGSVQLMPNGDVSVGWGLQPYFTQYRHDGKPILDGRLEQFSSYRTFRFPWTGVPDELPAVAAERRGGHGLRVYASWNGSTEVARWSVVGGPARGALSEIGTSTRSGFETEIDVGAPADTCFVAARAVDTIGNVLATSPITRV